MDRRKRYFPNMLTGTAHNCVAWQQQEQQQQESTTGNHFQEKQMVQK
jgi:hypothetical protein